MAQMFKAGLPGMEVEFAVLDDGEQPGDAGITNYFEVTYRHIDSVLGWQHYAKMPFNRRAFWRELPEVIEEMGRVRENIRAVLVRRFPGSNVRPDDPGAMEKIRKYAATREGRQWSAAIEELRAISDRIMRLRGWVERVLVRAPVDVTIEKTVLGGKKRLPEDVIYAEMQGIKAMILAMQPWIGERQAIGLSNNIDFPGGVIAGPARTDRITTTRQMMEHLNALRSIGFVDWFEVNVVPPVREVHLIVDNALLYMRRVNRFLMLRVPTWTVSKGSVIRPDRNRLLLFAPTLFRSLRFFQDQTTGRALNTMFGRYMPLIRSNEMATRDATIQAVTDAVLAQPIGEEIESFKTHGRRWPSPVEMSLVSFNRFAPPGRIVEEGDDSESEGGGGAGSTSATERSLAATYSYAKPIFGMKGTWNANIDLVWWWVYGVTRQKGAWEAYSYEDALHGGEIDKAIGYAQGVVIGGLRRIHLYSEEITRRRTILRGDYQPIVRRALSNAQELIRVLEEEKQWKMDPRSTPGR